MSAVLLRRALRVGGVLVRQFGVARAASLFTARIMAAVLDKFARLTYSQHGEDQIIQYFFNFRRDGYYVDVGCNHPESGSNTFALYRQGWRGVCIDGNGDLVRRFRRARPNDVAVVAVVSNIDKEIVFTKFDDDLVSSVSTDHVRDWSSRRNVIEEIRVKPRRLDAILREHGVPTNFDLLSVDAEAHDFEVLLSLDLTEFRPSLIVVELLEFRIGDPRVDPVVEHLIKHGYRMIGFVMQNGYFALTRG